MDTRQLDVYIDRLVTDVPRWKDARRTRPDLGELSDVFTQYLHDARLLRRSARNSGQASAGLSPQSPTPDRS